MAKTPINVEEEYAAVDAPVAAPVDESPEQSTDIEVSPEQMTAMKQMASEGRYEELGKLTAELINAGAPAPTM